MDNSHVKLSEFSQHLSSADLARVLRSRVQNGKIIFDFSGIQSVSAAFFEELFGKLLESYGEEMFNQHVGWTGLSMGQDQMLSGVLSKHKHKR